MLITNYIQSKGSPWRCYSFRCDCNKGSNTSFIANGTGLRCKECLSDYTREEVETTRAKAMREHEEYSKMTEDKISKATTIKEITKLIK